MSVKDLAGRGPEFLPDRFLTGDLEGWGVLENPLGTLKSRYAIKANGRWDGGAQTLMFTETWLFDHGMEETLNWRIRKVEPGRYTGLEAKVEGQAVGEARGFAYH